ncbi:MAG: cell division protein ZapA [Eubacteriales bacterium]
MVEKTDVEVIIDGKKLNISGSESAEYIQKVAAYINMKISEYKKIDGFKRQSVDTQHMLLQLNIADEYLKLKNQFDELEEEMVAKEKELYDLKHELVISKVKLEEQEKDADALLHDCTEHEKKIVRLETELKEIKNRNNYRK